MPRATYWGVFIQQQGRECIEAVRAAGWCGFQRHCLTELRSNLEGKDQGGQDVSLGCSYQQVVRRTLWDLASEQSCRRGSGATKGHKDKGASKGQAGSLLDDKVGDIFTLPPTHKMPSNTKETYMRLFVWLSGLRIYKPALTTQRQGHCFLVFPLNIYEH